jgi:hypothetical protein
LSEQGQKSGGPDARRTSRKSLLSVRIRSEGGTVRSSAETRTWANKAQKYDYLRISLAGPAQSGPDELFGRDKR